MARSPAPVPRKLGRPPAADSADTRQRILDAARTAFAAHGYEVATNRSLATAAGITSGALYHYFESKLDLYIAIYEDVQTHISERFEETIQGHDTFIGRLHAILDASHQLNIDDRTLAQFLGAVRIDRRRHPEIEAAVRQSAIASSFYRDLIEFGVATGEIPKSSREFVAIFLDIVLTGLTDSVSDDDARHAKAIDAIKLALAGDIIRRP